MARPGFNEAMRAGAGMAARAGNAPTKGVNFGHRSLCRAWRADRRLGPGRAADRRCPVGTRPGGLESSRESGG